MAKLGNMYNTGKVMNATVVTVHIDFSKDVKFVIHKIGIISQIFLCFDSDRPTCR